MKTDELDLHLISLLSQNGRMSFKDMAGLVGVNERTVSNRVSALIENGIISIYGYINRHYFGYDVIADVYCQVEGVDVEEAAEKISRFSEVSYLAISFGDRDISLQVVAKSTQDIKDFVNKKLSQVPGLGRTTTVIVPTVVKEIYNWKPLEVEMVNDGKPKHK